MKKFLSYFLLLVCVAGISVGCHKSLNTEYEDTIIDDVDIEKSVEEEVSSNSVENNELDNIIHQNEAQSGEGETVNTEKTNVDEKAQATSGDDSNENVKIEPISNLYSSLNNKTNAWGFVRKPEGTQPEFYGPYTKILDAYEGIYAGNKDKKVIYLTFDEGYENGYTATILDTLKEKGVTAVFFVTLPYVKQNPELIQRMIDENQIIRKSHLESLFYARSYR